jgi:hypothetical protein
MILENHVHTVSFLADLVHAGVHNYDVASLISSLNSVLAEDNIECSYNSHGYLRRSLAEESEYASPGSPTFVTDVIMVCVCVLCAAMASGLTQVKAYI